MKKQKVTDERILAQKRKIGSDAFQILFLVLLASILIQQYIFKASFSQYAVEFVLFVSSSLYVLIRNFMAGNDIFDSAKSSQKLIVINSLVCGVVVAVVSALLNEHLFKSGIASALLAIFITFLCATVASFAVLKLFYLANKNRQKNIETHMNDDENK